MVTPYEINLQQSPWFIDLVEKFHSGKLALINSVSEKQEVLGCIRRDKFITVLYKQKSNTVTGEFLGRLVLGMEGDMVKVFGATIY